MHGVVREEMPEGKPVSICGETLEEFLKENLDKYLKEIKISNSWFSGGIYEKIHERFSREILAEIHGAIPSEHETISERINERFCKRNEGIY